MAYIGNQPAESFTSFATQEFSTSATTSYTLDHAVTNENEIALFVNNVRQQPGSGKAYTATGTALTLSAATASTDTMYCVFLGRALQTVTPATNSITAAMVGNDLISGKDALASEPADTDEFLVSDAGTLKRIDYSLIKGGGITEADQWRLTAGFSSAGDITSNLERVDTDSTYIGTGMTQSSGIFTFPSTGLYWIIMQPRLHMFVDDNQAHIELKVTTDNSSYATRARATAGENESGETRTSVAQSYFFDVTNTSTHKVKFALASVSTTTVDGDTDINHTSFTFIRLGDT
jgi:hypothetical protein